MLACSAPSFSFRLSGESCAAWLAWLASLRSTNLMKPLVALSWVLLVALCLKGQPMSDLNTAALTPYLIQMVEEGGRTQFESQKTLHNRIMKPKPFKYVNGKGYRIPSQFTRPTGITAGASE